MLLSVAMIFAPIFESVPVYAAEAGTEMEEIGTMLEEAVGQTGTGDADDTQLFSVMSAALFATTSDFSNVGGWNESIYAEIAGVSDTDVTAVSWSGTMTGSLMGDDLTYLVRDNGSGGVRIDIPGLKAGTYTLSVTVGGQTLTKSGIEVYAYDRSGYAHFKYTDGVGAYKDDGTLKDNAIVLYVTDENKNDVTVTCGGITVKGIGNILNSAGQESSGGKTSNGGKANTNQGIIKKLAEAGTPLVVRFVGTVSESGLRTKGTYNMKTGESLIEGLTTYNSLDNGGSVGDNGHMARIQSGKDITLEGIGYDAVIDGWGFQYIAQSAAQTFGKSFEVRNLTFINTPEDAVGMEGVQANGQLTASVERCWIHNNEFYRPDITNPAEDDKAQGDGSVDFKKGQYYTCSYNYFERCHKTHLVGGGDEHLQYNITFHHNHYYLVESRGPLARQANIHMYNNLYERQTFYAMNPRANAYIFSEYNMFYASQNPQMIQSGGVIKSYHDCYASVIGAREATAVTDKATYVQNNCKYDKFDTDSKLSYIPTDDYKLDTDFTELRKVLVSQTGVQAQNPKQPAEVTASDYSVIPKNATNNELSSLPQTLTLNTSQDPYVFTVNEAFHLEIAYEGTALGVLVNEAGENLLTGNGSRIRLPAGTYMIQSEETAAIADPIKWKEFTVSMLKIEAAGDPSEVKNLTFHYNYEGAPAAVTVQAKLNKSYASVETLVPEDFRRDGYRLAGLYQDANLTQPVSYPYVVSEDAVFYADWNLSEIVKVLDCTKLTQENITKETTINGFTIHALSGGVGEAGKENPKYYMTVRPDGLCTNGVLLTDPSIPGNGDGLLKSIEFTTGGPAVLTVEMALSGKAVEGQSYNLVLAKKSQNGSLVKVDSSAITTSTTPTTKTFNIDGADTYYLYSEKNKGVVYYNLKLTEQVYTVRYQVGTGTVPEGQGSITAREGEEIELPVCTANPGYDFRGWSMDGGKTMLTSYTVKADDAVDGLITITAYYELISYTVKFDANGGTLPEGMEATRQATVEDTIFLGDCIPGKAGQQFLGWTVNNSGDRITKSYKVDPADAIEGKDGKELKLIITLKAVYTEVGKVYYMVKFDASDGKLPGTMESSCLKETDDILELGECTPPTAAQQFIGWSVDGTDKKVTSSYKVNDADAKDVDGQKVITLKAIYTEAGKTYYTVKFSAEGGKLPAGMSATVTAEAGDLLILGECTPPEADKRFKGWSVNSSAEPITSEYKVKAEDADGKGIIAIKAVYGEKDTGIAIIGLEEKYEYTGAKIIPNIGVVDYDIGDGRILAPGVDYSVQYKDNSKVGKAKVTVTGKGNYAGKDITQTFMIEEVVNPDVELKGLKGAKLGKIDAVTYNGKAHYPKLTLTLSGEGAVEYTYDETARVYKAADGKTIPANVAFSNNINKGTATVLLTGANDSKSKPTKLKKTFKINAIDISKAAMDVKTQPGTYGAKAASPASITVTCDGVKLKNGTDYTVKYSANKTATQSAKITITGKGNYTKKYTGATYVINKLDLSDPEVGIKAVTAYKGMTAGKVKATVTDKNGNVLKASQYILKLYRDESEDEESEYRAGQKLDEGEVYVKVVVKDGTNLTGETDIMEFDVATNIARAKTELRKVDGRVMTKEYTGQAITLDKDDLTVKINGVPDPLERGRDYEIVSYSNNINKGTATAVIQGKGSYSGTKTVKFKIVGKTMRIKSNTTWDDTSSLIQGLFGSR